jgi:hypothetical protein
MNIEMPPVNQCDVKTCGYNVEACCHAKAITIGDGDNPGCDTFFNTGKHCKDGERIAGVGACKVSGCQFNNDFECSAESIEVGFVGNKINCRTYKPRR